MPEPVDPPLQDGARGHAPVTKRVAPPPLEADTPRLVLVGIAVWVVALVVASVGERDRDVLWTCAAGIVLGLLGLVLARRAARSARPRPPVG